MTGPLEELPDELLSGYLDGVLTDEERRQVEDLLQTDADARARLEELRSLQRQLRSLPRISAPPDLRSRIARQIQEASTPADSDASRAGGGWSRIQLWTTVLSAMAASILALLTVPAWLNQDPDVATKVATPPGESSSLERVEQKTVDLVPAPSVLKEVDRKDDLAVADEAKRKQKAGSDPAEPRGPARAIVAPSRGQSPGPSQTPSLYKSESGDGVDSAVRGTAEKPVDAKKDDFATTVVTVRIPADRLSVDKLRSTFQLALSRELQRDVTWDANVNGRGWAEDSRTELSDSSVYFWKLPEQDAVGQGGTATGQSLSASTGPADAAVPESLAVPAGNAVVANGPVVGVPPDGNVSLGLEAETAPPSNEADARDINIGRYGGYGGFGGGGGAGSGYGRGVAGGGGAGGGVTGGYGAPSVTGGGDGSSEATDKIDAPQNLAARDELPNEPTPPVTSFGLPAEGTPSIHWTVVELTEAQQEQLVTELRQSLPQAQVETSLVPTAVDSTTDDALAARAAGGSPGGEQPVASDAAASADQNRYREFRTAEAEQIVRQLTLEQTSNRRWIRQDRWSDVEAAAEFGSAAATKPESLERQNEETAMPSQPESDRVLAEATQLPTSLAQPEPPTTQQAPQAATLEPATQAGALAGAAIADAPSPDTAPPAAAAPLADAPSEPVALGAEAAGTALQSSGEPAVPARPELAQPGEPSIDLQSRGAEPTGVGSEPAPAAKTAADNYSLQRALAPRARSAEAPRRRVILLFEIVPADSGGASGAAPPTGSEPPKQ